MGKKVTVVRVKRRAKEIVVVKKVRHRKKRLGNDHIGAVKEMSIGRGDHTKGRPKLSAEEVERMFDLYCRDFTIVELTNEFGASSALVRRYIEVGDEDRGIEPFRIRRAQIVRAAMLMQSGKVTQRMAQRAASLMQTFQVVNGRFLSRIAAAAQLDDPDLYVNPRRDVELSILKRKALEPTSNDLVAAVKMGTEIDRLAVELEGTYSPQSPVTVNVSQQQAQASPEMNKAVERVYAHIDNLGKADDTDRVNIGNTVRSLSYSNSRVVAEDVPTTDPTLDEKT